MATDYEIIPDRFLNFFNDLENRKHLLTTITDLQKTLTDHFTSLDKTLTQKSQTLECQIKEFKDKSKKSLENLENRENGIPELESVAAAHIEEQKASAISDIQNSDGSVAEKPISEALRICCKRMDGIGLVELLVVKGKESLSLRSEITAAANEAVDSMRLVVDALEEFVEMKSEGKVSTPDRRWACGMLIQAVLPVPASSERRVCVAKRLKERAVVVLEKWKGCLGGREGSGGVGAAEATMFLQMVIGFGLKEKFEDEFLKKLVLDFAGRRDMPKLAVALDLFEKMEDIIDELVKRGKEIEAVYFAAEAGLTEKFAPISLIKSCLRNCRRTANTISKNGSYSSSAVGEANNSELIATKAIIKCIEDHKLEAQFDLETLNKRITQLEKTKSDKKKSGASTSKPSNKRPHGGNSRGGRGGGPTFRPPKSGRFSNSSPAFHQRNPRQVPPTRYSAAPYNYGSPSVTAAGYGGGQNTVGFATHYPPPQYGSHDVGTSEVRSSGSYAGQAPYGAQANYSPYDYNAAPPPPGYPSYPPQ